MLGGMVAVPWPLNLVVWKGMWLGAAWPNCLCEDPQCSVISSCTERVKSFVSSGSPNAGALVKSLIHIHFSSTWPLSWGRFKIPLNIDRSVQTPKLDQPHREGLDPQEAGTSFQPHEVITDPRFWAPSVSEGRGLWSSLSLHSISNHAYTITQRLSQYPPLLSPQVSLSDAPFLGAPRRWSVSSSTHWIKTSWLGTGPRPLPDPVAIPGELVCPFNESGQGSAIQRVRAPFQKSTENTIRYHASLFVSGSSVLTWLSHQSGGSRGQCSWNLAGVSRNVAETSTWETKHHTQRVGELRFITPVGPEELTLQALSPEQRGYRVFIHGQGWFAGLQVCRG